MPESPITLHIPGDLTFADLKLQRDPDGFVSFDARVVERICVESGLPGDYFAALPEDALASFITSWYHSHVASGGARDATQEDLIEEVRLEDERGFGLSHASGRA